MPASRDADMTFLSIKHMLHGNTTMLVVCNTTMLVVCNTKHTAVTRPRRGVQWYALSLKAAVTWCAASPSISAPLRCKAQADESPPA